MSVRQSKSGRFIIDYYPNGRRGRRVRMTLPESITNIDTARAIERDMRNIQQAENKATPKHRTVKELWPEYRDWFELHRQPESYEDLVQAFKNNVIRILGHVDLVDLGSNHTDAYKRIRKSDKITRGKNVGSRVGNQTINKELCYFSGMLTWAREKGYNIPTFKIDRLPHNRPIPIVLTLDETVRLISEAEPLYRAVLLCLYSMGLRSKEARLLHYEDVDRQSRTIRVIQKGGTYKMLSIPTITLQAIEDLGPWGKGYIFLSRKYPGEPVKDLRTAIERARIKAGIIKNVTPHLLRHSIATHLLSRGINLRTIQKGLGHSNIQTTEFYTQVVVEDIRNATDSHMLDYSETANKRHH